MNSQRLIEIQGRANELLKRVGLDLSVPPVNVESIAEYLDIDLIKYRLQDEISGVLYLDTNRRGKIGINKDHHKVRQRFTIAHEIGHYELFHSREDSIFIDQPKKHMSMKFYRDGRSSTGDYWQEREANAFAASLLMPDFLVEKIIQNCDLDLSAEDSLKELADKFEVSSQAMAYRLSNLGFLSY
jgi:Zn-dependent peptidase ImmA (M78 family)